MNLTAYLMAINDDVTSIIYMDIILSNTYISPIFSDIRLQYFEANPKYTLDFYSHYSQYLILIIYQWKCKYLIHTHYYIDNHEENYMFFRVIIYLLLQRKSLRVGYTTAIADG